MSERRRRGAGSRGQVDHPTRWTGGSSSRAPTTGSVVHPIFHLGVDFNRITSPA